MVLRPLGALSQCPCNYPSGTWERLLWEQHSPRDYPPGEWEAISCGSMRLQCGCLHNYPPERQTVEWGDSSLPFLRESGSFQVSLVAVPRQPPRFPLRETLFASGIISRRRNRGGRSDGFVERVASGSGKVFTILLSYMYRVRDVGQDFCCVRDKLRQHHIPGRARSSLAPGNASARDAGPMTGAA